MDTEKNYLGDNISIREDEDILNKKISHLVLGVFHQLASELMTERPGTDFKVKRRSDSSSDDPAKFVYLFQLGPDIGFLGPKKHELANVKDSHSKGCTLQVYCYDPAIEERLVSRLTNLAETQGLKGLYLNRREY